MQLKYLRVYHQIKEKLLDQTLHIGDSIGTEEELADLYGVSRVTVRKALNLLKEEGILESRRGSGNGIVSVLHERKSSESPIVPGPVIELTIPKPWNIMHSLAAVDIVVASPELAEWFGVSQGTEFYRVQHLRFVNEIPYQHISTYYPISVTPGLESKQVTVPVSLYVNKEYGLHVDKREDMFSADAAGFREMQYLRVELKDPLLVHTRFLYSGEKLLEVSVSKINAKIAKVNCSYMQIEYLQADLAESISESFTEN